MTRSQGLDLAGFERLLDAWGADLTRWPAEERHLAEVLLRDSEAARTAQAAARRFEALLDSARVPEPALDLAARIVSALPVKQSRRRAAAWPFATPLVPALGWAAAAALGLFVGSSGVSELDLFSAMPDDGAQQASFDQDDDVDDTDDSSELDDLALGVVLPAEDE
jgi:hypothetical protein